MVSDLLALGDAGDLAEHFFIALPHSRTDRISMILDLFTPNGMPLLAVNAVPELSHPESEWCAFLENNDLVAGREVSFCSDIYPMTMECLQGFIKAYKAFQADQASRADVFDVTESFDILRALARWSYAAAKAIPAGPLHPLSAIQS